MAAALAPGARFASPFADPQWRDQPIGLIVLAMADPASETSFEPVQEKDGSGWYVRLTRPAMLPQQIGDFKTEAEARAWISAESAKWLERFGSSKPA